MNADARSDAIPVEGCWSVSERTGQDGRKDVHFRVHNGDCPTNQQILKNEIEKFLTAIKIIYPKKGEGEAPNFSESFEKLLALSKVGLVGKTPNTKVASDALVSLKADIFEKEAGKVKNQYMIKFGFWSFSVFFILLILYLFIEHFSEFIPAKINTYKNFLLLSAGTAVGVWASFATRKVNLDFYDLVNLEEDKVDPPLRIIFSTVLASILGLIFLTGFADVVFGSFKASFWIKSGSTALLVGALAGISEKALPAAVMQHSQSFIQNKRLT